MMNKRIYLDHASTTPVDPEVEKAMLPYFREKFGNPSSIHSFGQEAQIAVDNAREVIADFLGCALTEIYFTSSASEANNWVLWALSGISKKPHYLVSAVEHKSIIEPARALERRGVIELDFIPVDQDCLVDPLEVEKRIKENTVLVSLMVANSEVGVIQPVAEIGRIIARFRKSRQRRESEAGPGAVGKEIYFHTDAAQGTQFLPLGVSELKVDYLTLSGHKIYGPKGVGILYAKKGSPLEPLIRGGSQEYGKRAGTENVPAIVGLGKAIELVGKNREAVVNKVAVLRDKLREGIVKVIPGVKLNGSFEHRLPNNLNLGFGKVEGDSLVIALDQKRIAVSTGSACTAKAVGPSHVLEAMNLSEEEIKGSIRITLGKNTTEEEINKVVQVLSEVIAGLRGANAKAQNT